VITATICERPPAATPKFAVWEPPRPLAVRGLPAAARIRGLAPICAVFLPLSGLARAITADRFVARAAKHGHPTHRRLTACDAWLVTPTTGPRFGRMRVRALTRR